MPGGISGSGRREDIGLFPALALREIHGQQPLAAECGNDIIHRLARQQVLLAHLLLGAEAVIADRIEHQHPVIIDTASLGPLRIDPAAFDDRVVDPVVQLLGLIAHIRSPPFYNPNWDYRTEEVDYQDGFVLR